jgi:hypothetical protein
MFVRTDALGEATTRDEEYFLGAGTGSAGATVPHPCSLDASVPERSRR